MLNANKMSTKYTFNCGRPKLMGRTDWEVICMLRNLGVLEYFGKMHCYDLHVLDGPALPKKYAKMFASCVLSMACV